MVDLRESACQIPSLESCSRRATAAQDLACGARKRELCCLAQAAYQQRWKAGSHSMEGSPVATHPLLPCGCLFLFDITAAPDAGAVSCGHACATLPRALCYSMASSWHGGF